MNSPAAERERRAAARLSKRRRQDRLFRGAGMLATCAGLGFVALLFVNVIGKGYSAFVQTQLLIDVTVPGEELDGGAAAADYDAVVGDATRALFPQASLSRDGRRDVRRLFSIDVPNQVRAELAAQSVVAGDTVSLWVSAASDVDMLWKGKVDPDVDETLRRLSDRQLAMLAELERENRIALKFNSAFFTNGDSREAELAGIRGAMAGSFFMLLVTLLLAFPTGLAAAIYLEEFAPRNRWSDLIEVNINNLAAVPSIVFGLLGLAVFVNWFGLPRSAPLVGGLVLATLSLPVIIISARASIRAVPQSLREGAAALGASRMQVLFDHVLPLAMPGILTGTIIAMSRALGETAPLLLIGMVAFIVDVPTGFTDPATALPVQIYLWSDSPELAFAEKTSAAIVVLLAFLIAMNVAAILLRKRLETK